KQLGTYRQSRVFFFQTSRRSLARFVCLLPVFPWFVCVRLPPYNLRVAGLSQKSTFPAHPCFYISLYLTAAYPIQRYPLVCFSQVPAIHPVSFACYVQAGRETLHIKHRPHATCASLIGIRDVENLSRSLYRQICILQVFQPPEQLPIVFPTIDRYC